MLFGLTAYAQSGAQADAPSAHQVGQTPLAPPSPTNSVAEIPLSTFLPSIPTQTPTLTPTLTLMPTLTQTPTPSPTLTPIPSPTPPLWTPTLAIPANSAVFVNRPADFSAVAGWSCDDFPCEDDIDGFRARIRVPAGYRLGYVGRLPGQPMSITYGRDGRLYATVITDPVLNVGAVYALDSAGNTAQISTEIVAPLGLAFQPGTDVLYVSGRVTLTQDGGLWRVDVTNGDTTRIIQDLPCCFQVIDNQPSGLAFGPDGYLYMGVGALTDRAEPPNPRIAQYAELQPLEAAILRIQPHTAQVEVFARGIRNPYGLTFDSFGRLYATDNGLLTGQGDRLLQVAAGAHYGWPYWRGLGCAECPIPPARNNFDFRADLLRFPDYTLPRGVVAYTGADFPSNVFNHLFVALWHNTPDGQRVVRIDPNSLPTDPADLAVYTPEPFITGLIRPVALAIAPDGALVVADYIYGHVWAVTFDADAAESADAPALQAAPPLFITSTPRPTTSP